MKNRVVIGANLGDEGKGTVVATYAKHATGKVLNVLTNGGAQRAHSILTDSGSYTFQHFGSGTVFGATNYYSKYFILNPIQFCKELKDEYSVDLYRDPDCLWSTPYDMMANLIIEEVRGDHKHGSCGMGIWRTLKRYKDGLGLKFDDFMRLSIDKRIRYLLKIKNYYEKDLILPDHWKSIWNGSYLLQHFISDCELMKSKVTPISFHELISNGNFSEVIFENGQGLMLSDRGFDESDRTPSVTGLYIPLSLIIEGGISLSEVSLHYVTRSYMTRHGNGLLINESDRLNISNYINEDRTNHYNESQGEFRYANLNIDDLKSRIVSDAYNGYKLGITNVTIELTHCDEVDLSKDIKDAFSDIGMSVNAYDSPLIK